MTDDAPAAFSATIHGFRTIPSRGVVSVTIEAPIEQHAHIAAIATHGSWVAVARLVSPEQKEADAERPRPTDTGTRRTDKAGVRPSDKPESARSFSSLPLSQQCALTCDRLSFRRFLAETYGDEPGLLSEDKTAPKVAAELVRNVCDVASRSEFDKSKLKAAEWQRIFSMFRAWESEASIVPEETEGAHG